MASVIQVDTIQTSLGTSAITFDSSGRMNTPNRPHAICKMVSLDVGAYNNLANGSVITPTNVLRNIGGVYNSSNGRFTAPVAGLYEMNFHSNMYTNPAASWVMIRTWINGSNYTDHYSDKVATNWQYFSTHDLMYLNANDYVYVTGNTASGTTGTDINNYTILSFALIG